MMTLIFYIFLFLLLVFFYRSDLKWLFDVNQSFVSLLPLYIIYSLLIFVTIFPWQSKSTVIPLGLNGYFIVNLFFYLSVIITVFRSFQIGFAKSIKAIMTAPIIFFTVYSLICLFSAMASENIAGTPNYYNTNHAFRLISLFLGISIFCSIKLTALKTVKQVFYWGVLIVLIRLLLPFFYGLSMQNIMPWEWFDLDSKNIWLEDRPTSLWFKSIFTSNYSAYFAQYGIVNHFGIHVNTLANLIAINCLLIINIMIFKKQFYKFKYIVPLVLGLIFIQQLDSQTAIMILVLGVIFVITSRASMANIIILSILVLALVLFKWSYFMNILVSFSGTRMVRFEAAFNGFLDSIWFGHGFPLGEVLYLRDYVTSELPSYWVDLTEVHNSFLSVLFNTGLLGAIPFLIGVVYMGWIFLKYWIKSEQSVFSTNVLILFVASLISSLTLTDVWYKFDDLLILRMFPFFMLLVTVVLVQKINSTDY